MNSRLLKEIEDKRFIMVQTVLHDGISSEKAIRYSQELDVLINQYLHMYRIQEGSCSPQ
ncbi:aspartyl-phosphate phosphatase Spo0E family protein [Salisediminibacterium beveridgei]|uniref:aspartyl-phosphate phosphatase Spo0E family protein n=1 Tax=Salisediminibacterium beveridgei TaxID=632773 RepID=UPI000A037314|nr:aspartyl-phosphate phosphatase Spo0E family protein [Salisediminibacterium beveridgei]